jgi:hypothetical protein
MADSATEAKTVTAMFETEEAAGRAAEALENEGFAREQIGIIAGYELSEPEKYVSATENTEAKVMGGVGKGLALGGGLGAVAGTVSALLIPGVGPLMIGGALATTFLGAGLGGAVGGVAGGLMKAGVDESDARLFESALRHGGVVLTVHTDQAHARKAVDILDASGALDMDEHLLGHSDHGVDRVEGSTNNRVSDTKREHSN